MKSRFKYSMVAMAIASQMSLGVMNTYAADEVPAADAAKPKFIMEAMGVLNVLQAVTGWFANRPTLDSLTSMAAQPNPVAFTTPMQFPTQYATPAAQPTFSPSYAATPIIIGQPDIPLNPGTGGFSATQPWNSTANYQGVQVTVVVLNSQNQPVETRPLNANFQTGERFKLQLISTFEAQASVDAYKTSPSVNGALPTQNWAGQLYPAKADQVVKMRTGEMVQLPLGANEYFTFDNQTGLDRLMLNVRHAQAKGAQANSQPVYRQDSGQNSTFMQLTPQGTYPAVSQLLTFQHN